MSTCPLDRGSWKGTTTGVQIPVDNKKSDQNVFYEAALGRNFCYKMYCGWLFLVVMHVNLQGLIVGLILKNGQGMLGQGMLFKSTN